MGPSYWLSAAWYITANGVRCDRVDELGHAAMTSLRPSPAAAEGGSLRQQQKRALIRDMERVIDVMQCCGRQVSQELNRDDIVESASQVGTVGLNETTAS